MSIWLRHSFTRPSEFITSYLSHLYIIGYKDSATLLSCNIYKLRSKDQNTTKLFGSLSQSAQATHACNMACSLLDQTTPI